jgi:hypothetical protein
MLLLRRSPNLLAVAVASSLLLAPGAALADDATKDAKKTVAIAKPRIAMAMPPASILSAPAPSGVAPDTVHGEGDGEKPIDYDTPRYEPAGFPIVGGTSDIGVMGGGVFTLTRFDHGQRPYVWNMDLVASASAKGGPSGTEVAQQSYLWQWDVPGLAGGKLRLNPATSYEQTINQGYYGVGNATPLFPANVPQGDLSRYNEFVAREARVRELTRVKLAGPVDLMVASTYRYVSPESYDGSRLVHDASAHGAAGAPIVRGMDPLSLGQLGIGVVYDTRDNEFFPHRGMYHQVGVKVVQGLPADADVRYGEVGAILAGFVPVARGVVVASRLFADGQMGNVPFYDLSRAGPFMSYDLVGGAQGVRGVPVGRYAGLVKVVGNVELRGKLASFHVAKQSMHVGGDLFFDTGRAFADYTFHAASDGGGVGLKYGAGAGTFLQWGEAAIFRVDVAYSPDAAAENPSLPLGFYVQDGMMF